MITSIKQQAKALLKKLPGKYALFALPILLTFVNLSVSYREGANPGSSELSFSVTVFPILASFLLSFFTISALYTMLEVVRRERTQVAFSDVTRSFASDLFGKLFFSLLVRGLLIMLWTIPSAIGGGLIGAGAVFLNQSSTTNTGWVLLLVGILIAIISIILVLWKSYQYSQTEFVVFDQVNENRYQGPLAAIKESKQLMKGHIWQMFFLYLSFIGWYLLAIPTLGLILIYVIPYINTTRSVYYQYLKEERDGIAMTRDNQEDSAIFTQS